MDDYNDYNSYRDPNQSEYYFSTITFMVGILALLNFCSMSIENKAGELERNESNNESVISPISLNEQNQIKVTLRFRYLICYLIVRGSIWSKAAYIFILYLNYHKFTVAEVGLLYIVDNVSSLLFSPITGVLTDMYGRKLFAIIYNISVILNLLLRFTGIKWVAIIAQILTGFGNNLISTAYESWIVCESNKLFKDKNTRNKYLKKLFKK